MDMAHEKGFKALITTQGETAVQLAQTIKPAALTLDLHLPDMDGWVVLERLKQNNLTRHIPVHVISVDDDVQRGVRRGAIACLKKPVSKKALTETFAGMKDLAGRRDRHLLIVEDNQTEREHIVKLVGNGHVHVTAVATAAEALAALKERRFDCVVLDLLLPDMSGIDLVEKIRRELGLSALPVIVYTGKDLSEKESVRLRQLAETVIAKTPDSHERLLGRVAAFLHQVETVPPDKQQMFEPSREHDPLLAGKKVLIVDDDIRNLFALTSMLERWRMEVRRAENGRQALEMLEKGPDVDLVLMDIMMPELDGYETIRAIRRQPQFRSLPVIALTAKAMKMDRQNCLDAGASDYVAKPVKQEQLLAMLRVWLDRREQPVPEIQEAGALS